jgi:large subunit ribosomal protein L4
MKTTKNTTTTPVKSKAKASAFNGTGVQVFAQNGKESGTITLSEAVFGVAWNKDLMHEVVTTLRGNARVSTAHTKDRSEVRGGGKKPWKQKGTGRARHGSSRSPIWAGGGVAHGPRNAKDYSRKLNKNVRSKALAISLSKKFADGDIIFVDSLSFELPKTAQAKEIVLALAKGADKATLASKRKNAALIVLPKRDAMVEKSFQNFGSMEVVMVKDVNPLQLLTYKYVVIVDGKAALEILETRASKKNAKVA